MEVSFFTHTQKIKEILKKMCCGFSRVDKEMRGVGGRVF
jgi:hypothetical protein